MELTGHERRAARRKAQGKSIDYSEKNARRRTPEGKAKTRDARAWKHPKRDEWGRGKR